MINNIKTIDIKNPNIGEIKLSNLQEMMIYKNKITEIIVKEFNEFYNNPIRQKSFDWSKVARTSYLDVLPKRIKNREFVFEIFEMEDIQKGEFITHYKKGKVLEQMTIKICWI
jgi:hypothetical protein